MQFNNAAAAAAACCCILHFLNVDTHWNAILAIGQEKLDKHPLQRVRFSKVYWPVSATESFMVQVHIKADCQLRVSEKVGGI